MKEREISTLGYALLGVLAREPLSGYDISQRMKVPVGFFWHAQRSQIYPELARLESRGLVRHRRVEQVDRPDKKVYSITEAGRAVLRHWVTEPAEAPPRNELILKVYSLWVADPAQALGFVRQREQHHAEQLAAYEEARARLEREAGRELQEVSSPVFATYATLQAGIGYARWSLDWCRWLADRLQEATTQQKDGEG